MQATKRRPEGLSDELITHPVFLFVDVGMLRRLLQLVVGVLGLGLRHVLAVYILGFVPSKKRTQVFGRVESRKKWLVPALFVTCTAHRKMAGPL